MYRPSKYTNEFEDVQDNICVLWGTWVPVVKDKTLVSVVKDQKELIIMYFNIITDMNVLLKKYIFGFFIEYTENKYSVFLFVDSLSKDPQNKDKLVTKTDLLTHLTCPLDNNKLEVFYFGDKFLYHEGYGTLTMGIVVDQTEERREAINEELKLLSKLNVPFLDPKGIETGKDLICLPKGFKFEIKELLSKKTNNNSQNQIPGKNILI